MTDQHQFPTNEKKGRSILMRKKSDLDPLKRLRRFRLMQKNIKNTVWETEEK